jgi:L-cysteine desulfidase
MDLLGTSINAAVVAVVGALLAWLARGRFDALERRIDRLESRLVGTETRLDGRIDGVGSRLDGRFDALQSSMDAMRSDLTQVALAVGVPPRAQNH